MHSIQKTHLVVFAVVDVSDVGIIPPAKLVKPPTISLDKPPKTPPLLLLSLPPFLPAAGAVESVEEELSDIGEPQKPEQKMKRRRTHRRLQVLML